MIAVVNLGMQQICCYNGDGKESISRIWTVSYLTLIQKLGRERKNNTMRHHT